MAILEWDTVGERFYNYGIDRGVLYLPDGTAVPWNGLTGVDEGSNPELNSYYIDGFKFFEVVTPGDFIGRLKAFTYPDEFNKVLGIIESSETNGLLFHEQKSNKFNLTYRNKIGNDLNPDLGYEIHLFYNLSAIPENKTFDTVQELTNPTEFAWSLSGIPVNFPGYRPTAHVSFNSLTMDPSVLANLEDILYGTETTVPRFPTVDELIPIPPITELVILSPDNTNWTITVTTDGTLDIVEGGTGGMDIYILRSPSGTFHGLMPTNDGTLELFSMIGMEPYYYQIVIADSDGVLWAISATDDNDLDVSAV